MTRKPEKLPTASTKDRILDAAETLFANEGFHCTSLRTLTKKADVNLAAVNYHFGSKEALVEAMMERRLQALNPQREALLDKVLERALNEERPPRSEDILRAFIEPTINFSESGKGPRHFIAFIGRILMDPDDSLRNMFLKRIRPLFVRFYKAMCEALPEVPPQTVFMRLQMTLGLISHVMCSIERYTGTSREFPLPPGIPPIENAQELCEVILEFVLPGLEKS